MKPIVFLSLRALAIGLGLSLVSDSIGYLPVKKAATVDYVRVASLVFWIVIGFGLTNVGLLLGFRNYSSTTKRVALAFATVITVPISLAITFQLWGWLRSPG